MRLTCTLVLLCLYFHAAAQEENSLLWEISGNGLEKTSYLYGTMHVSKKIAFRLDDVFYEALQQSEKVALESDPATWLENDIDNGSSGYAEGSSFSPKGFYTHPFIINNPSREDLAAYLAFEDRLVNNILYRTNESDQNFEEETYLDMFIYQAGSKFNKPIIALEDLEESTALVGRASLNSIKQKPDEWLQKKMQRQDLMYLMQDAYRERNINLLDSIDRAMYTDHYLENMLYIRNANMAHRLDSVMRKAKIFAGIGAAHLPGEAGVISLLRNMGYTVDPLVSASSEKGKSIKEAFESKIRDNTYVPYSPDDNLFTISLPARLYPVAETVNTTYISPDLANGSYFMLNRVPTFSFLKKESAYSMDDIEGLLFENIPGKIKVKTRIRKNGYEGLDITNQLKNGDYQRYQIFRTPLEILIFKMGGEGDYVAVHSDTIFNSLKFRKFTKEKVKLASGFRDFEVSMPSMHRFTNRYRKGYRQIEAYDSISSSYYFLRKATLNDFNFIEEDTFELKQIQKRFYKDLNLNPTYRQAAAESLESQAMYDTVTNRTLYLKTTLRRGDYYLLGILTNDAQEATEFFGSFRIKPVVYPEPFRKVRDTALFFTTVSSVKPPKFVESSRSYFRRGEKAKSYAPYSKKTVYQNKNDEAITVELNKSHDYLTFPGIDSIWTLRRKQYAHKKFRIHSEKSFTSPEGYEELQLTLSDTASTRGILIKNVLKGGILYEVKAQVDTVGQPSRFVSEFFENFKPADTLIGRDIMADKTTDFFADLRANDSIVLSGYRFVLFDNRHIDSLKHYISAFDFPEDKKHIQSHLIQKLGRLNDPRVTSFFREFYDSSYTNSGAQIRILQAISRAQDENSVRLLLDLMSRDLPLVANPIEIRTIFKPYCDSLPLARKLFPDILDYSGIAEYKSPIFSLLAELKSKDLIRSGSYRNYKKQLLTDANIQLKRYLGQLTPASKSRRTSRSVSIPKGILEDYAVLLFPFSHEKEVAQFFDRLQRVPDPGIKTAYATLLARYGREIPTGMLDSLAADVNSRALLFSSLEGIGKTSVFPQVFRSRKAMAEAALFEKNDFDENKVVVQFMEQKNLLFRGTTYTGFYFKLRKKQEYDKNFKMHLVVFKTDDPLKVTPFYKNKGMRIEDTDTDSEAMEYVTEEFMLKDRKRAVVFRPDQNWGYTEF